MSYSISLSGHGAAVDDVKEVFENTVRALRAVTPEGASPVGGQASGSDPDGGQFSIAAGDVVDIGEPADAGQDDQPDGESDPAAEAPAGTEPSDDGAVSG